MNDCTPTHIQDSWLVHRFIALPVGFLSLGLSKVKMSPSHLAALLGVLGSELQLDRRLLFLFGDTGSSVEESRSGCAR